MDIILVPGLWLDASSWDAVVPTLTDAGHRTHPLTLPGTGAPAAESADIGIADWVAAVVAQIDALPGEVVVVGHSGGGNVTYGALDARPERVAHLVLVDTVPPPDGSIISEFEVVDGVIPFPGWDSFDEPDVADIDETTRRAWAARTLPVPAGVPMDPIHFHDLRRHRRPVTVLSGPHDEGALRAMLEQWPAWGSEFTALEDVRVVHLGTGHWPQFTQPTAVGQAILDAIAR